MANPSKAKGTRWESAVVAYLHSIGLDEARRQVQAGAKDIGDIGGLPGFILEAKDAARLEFSEWVRQARREADNAGVPYGAVVAKRRRAAVEDAYAVMDLETLGRLLLERTHSEDVLDQPDTVSLDAMFEDREGARPWVYVDEIEARIHSTLPEGRQ